MKYPASIYQMLKRGVFQPTWMTLGLLLFIYVIIQFLPESIKPSNAGAMRMFWLWQIAAIIHTFKAYLQFSKQAHPVFFTETKQILDKVFLLGIAALFVWTFAYPYILESKKYNGFAFKASIEIATWFLMCAYLCVNGVTLYVLDRRIIRTNKSQKPTDSIDVRYSQLLRRIIMQVDLPCLIPFSIILGYAILLYRANMDWETFMLGASAILLFVSNILSSSLSTLWEEELMVN